MTEWNNLARYTRDKFLSLGINIVTLRKAKYYLVEDGEGTVGRYRMVV